MKRIPNWVYLAIAIVLFGGTTLFLENKPVEYEVTPEENVATTTIEQTDVLDDVRKELEKANQNLNAEEVRLLEERAVIDARLEEITAIRTSF